MSEAVVGFFLMSICLALLLYPFPSRTSLLSPSELRHRKHLATAGTTDFSSLVIQHLSGVKIEVPLCSHQMLFPPLQEDHSDWWLLLWCVIPVPKGSCPGPAPTRLAEGFSEEFSLWRDLAGMNLGTEASAKQDTLQDLHQPGIMPRFYLQCE